MLLKILFLAVIAWFVLRAANNLIKAIARDQGGRPSTTINRHRSVETAEQERSEQNVEDAKFRDL